jgi:hypothetical protein
LALLMVVGLPALVAASPPQDRLTPEEMANAVVIDNPNQRPVEVGPEGSVVYRVRGTDVYLKVFGERSAGRTGEASPQAAAVTYTQTCGINV